MEFFAKEEEGAAPKKLGKRLAGSLVEGHEHAPHLEERSMPVRAKPKPKADEGYAGRADEQLHQLRAELETIAGPALTADERAYVAAAVARIPPLATLPHLLREYAIGAFRKVEFKAGEKIGRVGGDGRGKLGEHMYIVGTSGKFASHHTQIGKGEFELQRHGEGAILFEAALHRKLDACVRLSCVEDGFMYRLPEMKLVALRLRHQGRW